MPIPVQSVVSSALSALDAEGSDRYLFDQDFKPAINDTIKWMVMLFNAALSKKKVFPESLRELTRIGVWQTNKYSRVSFVSADVGDDLWTIIGVYPKCVLHPNNSQSGLKDDTRSEFSPGKTFIASKYSAERLTAEEWNENARNPFMPGNNVISQEDLISYGYRDFSNYSSSEYVNDSEIEIRPDVSKEFVAIEFLKKPKEVSLIGDNIQFPSSIEPIILQKVLNFISTKQGDQTTLYAVTERDIEQLTKLLS